MDLSAVISQLISLFLMMLVGFIAARIGITTPEFRKRLSTFTLYIASPCVILSSALSSTIPASGMVTVLAVAAAFYAVMLLIGHGAARLMRSKPSERGLDVLMLVFTNIGFMGMPVVDSVYGADGVAMVALFILMFNLTFFSYGVALISGSVKLKAKDLSNPCIFAAIGALFFALTGLRLPAVVESTLTSLGSMNTPLAMLIIGASLCHSDLRASLRSLRLYKISFVRMIVLPLLILGIIKLLPLSPMLAGVTVIMAAMPVAGNCAMLSDMYTPEDMTASQAVIVTTLLSAVTLPMVCALISVVL